MKSLTEAMDALVHLVGQFEGQQAVTGKILALNLIANPALEAWRERMTLVHWHRGAAVALEEQGIKVNREEAVAGGKYGEVWVLPDRQRECQLGDVARAWDQVEEGGRLIVSVRNDWGAKRLEDQWREIVGVPVETFSKHHCRCFSPASNREHGMRRKWEGGVRVQPCEGCQKLDIGRGRDCSVGRGRIWGRGFWLWNCRRL